MEKQVNSVDWYCVRCDNVLGRVVREDLAVILQNVVSVNSDGTSIVTACKKCGAVKVWYPTAESALIGAYNAIRRDSRRNR